MAPAPMCRTGPCAARCSGERGDPIAEAIAFPVECCALKRADGGIGRPHDRPRPTATPPPARMLVPRSHRS